MSRPKSMKEIQDNHNHHHWGYSNEHGPEHWAKYYPTGEHQSPINILVGGDCERIASSTCCTRHQCKADSLAHLSEQFQNSLLVPGSNNDNGHVKRRSHLDSTGEDHKRSSSTSSAGSSDSSRVDYDDDSSSSSSSGAHEHYSKKRNKDHCTNERALMMKQQQNTRHCVSHKKIFLGYPRYLSTMHLCNTGHNWQVNLPAELATHTLLAGPPLGDREYRLAQFHCHWGEDCDHGSEHQINGKSYSAELHFVHWNCTDFSSVEEASRHKHGLAVLGVLVQALEGEQNQNKHLEKIVQGLKKVQKPGSSTAINARLDLKKLFPANRWTYASYEGSLTTPPLSEVVDWIVFLNPIQCSTRQIEQFRHIKCPSSGDSSNLIKNCRPIQPSNGRLVSIWTHH